MTVSGEHTSETTPAPADRDGLPSPFKLVNVSGRLAIPWLAAQACDRLNELKTPGTLVRRGDALTTGTQLAHIPLAPCEGMITGSGKACLTDGTEVPAVIMESSPSPSQAAVSQSTPDDPPSAGVEALQNLPLRLRETPLGGWVDRLRDAGVWADRWGSPDLIGQLNLCLRRPIDTIVCNVLDEDAGVPLQGAVATEWPVEVAAGVLALANLTGAGRTWFVVPQDVGPRCWTMLRNATFGSDARLIPLPNFYPQSHPTVLVHELTGRHIRPGTLPGDHGVLLLDAAAAYAVGACVLRNEPMLRVPLAIHDPADRRTIYALAPIGIALRELLGRLGLSGGARRYTAGTPLRGVNLTGDCVVHGGELTVYLPPRMPDINPEPCIRCAWCVEACPVRIQPAGLLEAAQRGDRLMAEEYGLDACVECGICSYVCPSHLPLLKAIRVMRAGGGA